MATVKMKYAAKATLTWGMTNPASDTNLLIGRESTVVDNQLSTLYMDVIIGGSFTLHATTAAVGVIEVWAYGSWNEGTTFTSDITGTDAALTLIAETKALLRLVTVIPTAAVNSNVHDWGPIGLAQIWGGLIPDQWGLWGTHDSGGALAASTTEYQGVHFDSV